MRWQQKSDNTNHTMINALGNSVEIDLPMGLVHGLRSTLLWSVNAPQHLQRISTGAPFYISSRISGGLLEERH